MANGQSMRRIWLAMVLGMPVALASAQSTGGSYVLRKVAIASGGRPVATGPVLTATAGQPAAAVQSGASYRLTGGFHAPRSSANPPDPLFRNGFE